MPATLGDGQSVFMGVSYADIGSALISNEKSRKTKLTPVGVETADTVSAIGQSVRSTSISVGLAQLCRRTGH
ncbi:hypothetical protein V1281_005701 [Nitrobacteraceae bacterium AZCC 2161]